MLSSHTGEKIMLSQYMDDKNVILSFHVASFTPG